MKTLKRTGLKMIDRQAAQFNAALALWQEGQGESDDDRRVIESAGTRIFWVACGIGDDGIGAKATDPVARAARER